MREEVGRGGWVAERVVKSREREGGGGVCLGSLVVTQPPNCAITGLKRACKQGNKETTARLAILIYIIQLVY